MAEPQESLGGLSFFDRPGLAAARLAEGNIGAAARAAIAPSTLTARERQTLVEGLIGKQQAATPYGQVLSALSNPFVILGAVLAIKYPVLSAKKLNKFAGALGGYDRYVGKISKLFGSMDDTFRGTPIPGIFRGLARAIHGIREKFLGDTHALGMTNLLAKFNKTAKVPITSAESYRVAMKLDGLDQMARGAPGYILSKQMGLSYVVKPITLNKAEQELFTSLRKDWLPGHYKYLNAASKAGETQLRGDGFVGSVAELKKIEHYWPRRIDKTLNKLDTDTQLLATQAGSSEQVRKRLERVSSVHSRDRHSSMLPSRQDMKFIDQTNPGLLHPELRERLATEWQSRTIRAGIDPALKPPQEYTLNLVPTLERYTNSIARAFGFSGHSKQYGKALSRELGIARASGPNGILKAEMLTNTYIPWAKGEATLPQGVKAMEWSARKLHALDTLHSPMVQQYVPKSWRTKLESWILESHTLRSPGSAGDALTGWFYVSALGGNPASPALNLTQTLLTTVPMIGGKFTYKGVESVVKKGSQYFKLRMAGKTAAQAESVAFSEFAEAGLSRISPLDGAMSGALDAAWDMGTKTPGGMGEKIGAVKRALMYFFSGTERFNRLVAFEGGRLKAVADGVRGSNVLTVATEVMERSQFAPGIAGAPFGAINLPSWARQFTTFGAKYATQLANNVRGAVLGQQQLGGQLGRTLLGAGLAYEGAKRGLGVDVSHALVFGAIPSPRRDSPLGVLPFAPPALTLPLAAYKSLLDQDLAPIQSQLPLLVPGGVAAARAIGTVGGRVLPETVVRGVSKFIGKQYVDYSSPDEEGRYPLYTKTGKLVDHFTGPQLLLRSMGLPAGDIQREGELMGFILKQREGMREGKAAWLRAHTDNDVPGQRAIAEEYKERFGFDIPISKADIQRLELQKSLPRLQHLLKTLPKESRAKLQSVIGVGVANRIDQLYVGARE